MQDSPDASAQRTSNGAKIGFDADGRVLSVSGAAAKVLGYRDAEELTGRPLSSLIGEEAAITLLDSVFAAEELGLVSNGLDADQLSEHRVTFARQDGSRVSLETMLTPENSGGWLTLIDSRGGRSKPSTGPDANREIDVAAVLRSVAIRTGGLSNPLEICTEYARQINEAIRPDELIIARSSDIAGVYDALAEATGDDVTGDAGTVDLPSALIPAHGSSPVQVASLEALALFEPAVISGREATGAFLAARANAPDGAHILVIATAKAGTEWNDSAVLLVEAAALTVATSLYSADLSKKLGAASRAQETVRQIGVLASTDHDGGFLNSARRVMARRLPVSAISIHVADPVTGRCYVAATSGQSDDEHGDLAPGFEWDLAGSLEQQVLKSGRPVFISSSSLERVSVPPETIARWRSRGLYAIAAIPMKEAGQAVGVLVAGFSSAPPDRSDLFRLMESIAPAVHLGVGLSAGRPGIEPEPDESASDLGFISPKTLLALTRAATESPDSATLFASVTEWMLEIIPTHRVAWGVIDPDTRTYRRIYHYDPGSDSLEANESVPVDDEELQTLDMPALNVTEPGYGSDAAEAVRAAVMSDKQLLAVVTAWPRDDDEPFTEVNLARLERINEFIAGPLARVMETEAVIEVQHKQRIVMSVGAQASSYSDPEQALRNVRPLITKLLPHERAVLIEVDEFAKLAHVRYDSDTLPNETETVSLPLAPFSALGISDAEESDFHSLNEIVASDLFEGFASVVSIPVGSDDSALNMLLLLSEGMMNDSDEQLKLADALSAQLTIAHGGWNAHRSTREATRDLREVRRQLNLLLDSAPVAIISTDANGVCTWLEGHGLQVLGIKREQMLGTSIFELTGKLPELEDVIRQALRGAPASAVTPIGPHSAEVWAQPVTEIDGTVKGITIVGYDVSADVRNKKVLVENRELQKTLKERSRTVSTVSHELRNQLTSIIAYTDVLSFASEDQLTERQAHALSVIQRTAGKLDVMISDLLGLDYELDVSEVDVSSFMREIVDAQEPIFSSANQSLSLSLPNVPCTVQADHLRLTQVVTNLLSNASKYSPPEAKVSVEVAINDEHLEICVIDNGPGIPTDQLERVWDSGTRLASSSSRSVQGSGLGLSIARKIVELHGGTASIQSELGVGTTVTVSLPGVTVDQKMELKPSRKSPASNVIKLKPAAGSRGRGRRRKTS